MTELIFDGLLCHLVGDYVLQTEFLAKTKGSNWWHMLVHCLLYILPFYIVFPMTWGEVAGLFLSHLIIDSVKARWNRLSYRTDQLLHIYAIGLLLYDMIRKGVVAI